MTLNDPAVLDEVTAKFQDYEKALMTDDIEAMGNLFWESPHTIRLGVGENLYGIEAINAFRIARRGSPQRDLLRVEITTFGMDFAIANAEFRRHGSDKIGRQSQAWARLPDAGWRVVAAHVSIMGTTS
ncbi:MAG: oxalurate catabolism protein HpxZ [Hyphomonadaceae bacterium]|nr:oxalurate catabolism protein HpxZ [Hyphomonadaceae bacterium]